MDSPSRIARTNIPDVLGKVRLFDGWPATTMDRLSKSAVLRQIPAGQTLLEMNKVFPWLVIVSKGALVSQRIMASGKIAVFDFLLPGQMTSHVTVFDGEPNAFDIVARLDSEVVLIPRQTLLDIVRNDNDRMFDVLQFHCRLLRLQYEGTNMRIANSLRCQLAKTIFYWARGAGLPDSFEVPVVLVQDDLASLFGNARQSINRELSRMVKEGMLAIRHRRLYVRDMAAMARIIQDEDPAPASIGKALFERPKDKFPAAD